MNKQRNTKVKQTSGLTRQWQRSIFLDKHNFLPRKEIFALPTEPTICRRREATCPCKEEIKSASCFFVATEKKTFLTWWVITFKYINYSEMLLKISIFTINRTIPLSNIFVMRCTAYVFRARVRNWGWSCSNTAFLSSCEQYLAHV